jgi:hypothetical protein
MKLWKLSQTDNGAYDTYDSCVVAADTEDQAKATHPSGRDEPFPSWRIDWASEPSKVMCQYLGEAADGVPAGVICASYNAG